MPAPSILPGPIASSPPNAAAPARPLAVLAAADDLRRRLVLLTLARLAVATMLLGIVAGFAPTPGASPTSRGVLGVVVALYVASLGYAIILRRGVAVRILAWIQIAIDLAAWTALVYVTGGPTSPMSFFFGLSTLTAALVLGDGAARTTAIVAIVTYGVLMVGMTYGLITPLPDVIHRVEPSRAELALQLVTNSVGILLIATLGGSLASRVTRAGGALARVEESRATLAARYEDVLRSIPVALITCSPDGTIDSANPQAGVLFDCPVDRLLGRRITDALPFLPSDAFRAGGEPLAGDETLTERADTPKIAYRAAPLYDRDGRTRGGLVVIEDRSTLESLREAMQRAERLAVLGRLAAGLAHEIRNPLGAISGCVELVREGPSVSDEDRTLLTTVVREADRLNRLVTDMLAFARPRAPERAPSDLRAIARDVVTLARADHTQARIEVLDPDGPAVMANVDAGQIRQVLWNLVRNAAQVSPPGAAVEVSVRTLDGAAELAIADAGPGIARESRERIFDVFYSEKARGTGLGLAIVKQLLDAHGARISAEPRDEGGTRFVITFPAT